MTDLKATILLKRALNRVGECDDAVIAHRTRLSDLVSAHTRLDHLNLPVLGEIESEIIREVRRLEQARYDRIEAKMEADAAKEVLREHTNG